MSVISIYTTQIADTPKFTKDIISLLSDCEDTSNEIYFYFNRFVYLGSGWRAVCSLLDRKIQTINFINNEVKHCVENKITLPPSVSFEVNELTILVKDLHQLVHSQNNRQLRFTVAKVTLIVACILSVGSLILRNYKLAYIALAVACLSTLYLCYSDCTSSRNSDTASKKAHFLKQEFARFKAKVWDIQEVNPPAY